MNSDVEAIRALEQIRVMHKSDLTRTNLVELNNVIEYLENRR